MDIEELQLLLKEGEGLTTEFKERFSSKLDKDIVAFANTHGGRIFLGVNDQGEIIGETLNNGLDASSDKSSDKILNAIEKNPKITAKQLAKTVGITQRAVEKQLASLKLAGKLVRIGSKKTGYWKISESS